MDISIPDFTKASVLVVGDLILDRYWQGETRRISPEAPVPVVHISQSEERPGGAGNVALNLLSLGVNTQLLGVIGEDEAGQTLARILKSTDIECHFKIHKTAMTTTKLRVLSRQQQLIRLDFENKPALSAEYDLTKEAAKLFKKADVLILSDYGKGALSQIGELIKIAREQNKWVLVDPKSSDFSHYRGASMITPNYAEFEAVVGVCSSDSQLVEKARNLLQQHDIGTLLITRGSQGMTLIDPTQVLHLPAHAREVFDVTGAGDTVISVLAAGLAAGTSIPIAAALANLAASIVVGKLGAATVTVPELRFVMQSQGYHHDGGIVTEEQLIKAVAKAKAQREKIVMTNGCFDLLHAGHVAYLQEAKKLGHRLIVAVNDDLSVKHLKGEGRPVNTLSRRMAVLAALGVVDWVVSFSETTPERLISLVLPDFLVKGGDYKPDELAGAKAVIKNGGEVKILPFIPGCSTTDMVNRMSRRK